MTAADDAGNEVRAAVGGEGDCGAWNEKLVAGATAENQDGDREQEYWDAAMRARAGWGGFHAAAIIETMERQDFRGMRGDRRRWWRGCPTQALRIVNRTAT